MASRLVKNSALAAMLALSSTASSLALAQGAGSPLKGPNGDGNDASPADTYRGPNDDQYNRRSHEERRPRGDSEGRQ